MHNQKTNQSKAGKHSRGRFGIFLGVIIGLVVLCVVLFMLYKKGKLDGITKWMKMHKALVLGLAIGIILITTISRYYCFRLPSNKNMKQQESQRVVLEP